MRHADPHDQNRTAALQGVDESPARHPDPSDDTDMHMRTCRLANVDHYALVAERACWPSVLSSLCQTFRWPDGIIFDDTSSQARAQARAELYARDVRAGVWNGA